MASALLLATPGACRAQAYATGDRARNTGLGGGGIALRDAGASPFANPAALAVPVRLRLGPVFGGTAAVGERAYAALRNVLEFGDFDHLEKVGPGLIRTRHALQAAAGGGLRLGRWQLTLDAQGYAEGRPNAPTRRWVRQGAVFYPPPDARLVVDEAYAFGITLGHGRHWDLPGEDGGELDAGARLRFWRGTYARFRFRTIRERNDVRVVDRKQADLHERGVGADVGLRFTPHREPRLSLGLALNGLIEASLGRLHTQRTLDIGAAWHPGERTVLVIDVLNAAAGGARPRRFALGAEYRLAGSWLSVRGSLTTRGPAAGISLGSLHFAYATDGESTVGAALSFR